MLTNRLREAKNSYEYLIAKGSIQGEEKGRIKEAIKMVFRILMQFPEMETHHIVSLCGLDEGSVLTLKQQAFNAEYNAARSAIRQVLEDNLSIEVREHDIDSILSYAS